MYIYEDNIHYHVNNLYFYEDLNLNKILKCYKIMTIYLQI